MKSGVQSGKATIVPPSTFKVSEKTSLERKKSPTQTTFTSEINTSIALRSKHRRMQEMLLAASEINGGSKENRQPAIDGLFLIVDKYASVETCVKYLGRSKKLRDAGIIINKKHVSKFEAYLSTFSTGNITEKGYIQRKRLLVSGGIPKILPYKDLMHIINNVDIGELIPVGNLRKGVQMDVDGVHRWM